ncbi:hypothetical protein M2360_000836 [Rhizobium sp. SG_E_25_P2]|uniref:hypothetical protein n=1 Tax=Rhizobium sp. SG_E_25_P2 TaxID=2879942 RepID=UPI00247514D9|nr:hypothetical protein [Rhizobium sp. SG_E_25_P2]MDH6265446.1 hypothetical protein [Rhizobium sp. SG_E_25_P2]
MKLRYVIDTNVLIAASAADPTNPADIDATPKDADRRKEVWDWLDSFQKCESRLVLDSELKIFDEYQNKLGFNDYGIQVIMHKMSTAALDNVPVQYDENGHGIVPSSLETVVHDLADRKMVAAALVSFAQFGEGCIAFAGDTDWHDWETELCAHSLILEPIIEAWSRQKHAEKKQR